ncbi:hypothetical protein Bca52824_016537 [Brassica carinata]|uniref:Uncharacterized protein n=1 Tax=Brassica carinata TaxID=52824 RepID=A0A8X7W3T2_BRACI|nr:hypothetical protein Bca52824_016537 [Brassica carinata]
MCSLLDTSVVIYLSNTTLCELKQAKIFQPLKDENLAALDRASSVNVCEARGAPLKGVHVETRAGILHHYGIPPEMVLRPVAGPWRNGDLILSFLGMTSLFLGMICCPGRKPKFSILDSHYKGGVGSIRHRTQSSGDGQRSMSIGSRSRTVVGHMVLKITEIVGFTLLEPGSSSMYPSETRRRSFAHAFIMVVFSFRGSRRHVAFGNLERHVTLASFRSTSGYVARKSGSKVPGAVDPEPSLEPESRARKLESRTWKFGFLFWVSSSGNGSSPASFIWF